MKESGRLVRAVDDHGVTKLICLWCGGQAPHSNLEGCLYPKPGTAMWTAFADVEPEDDVVVKLPSRSDHYIVATVEPLSVAA